MPKKPRRWIQTHTDEWLEGSVRFAFSPEQRGVVADLWALAGRCGMDGLVAANEGQPFTHRWLAARLEVSESLLKSTLEILTKLKNDDYFKAIENGSGIFLVNFKEHQPKWVSEYDRQKTWRDNQKAKRRVLPEGAPHGGYQAAAERNAEIATALQKKVRKLRRELTPDEEQGVIDDVPKGR